MLNVEGRICRIIWVHLHFVSPYKLHPQFVFLCDSLILG